VKEFLARIYEFCTKSENEIEFRKYLKNTKDGGKIP